MGIFTRRRGAPVETRTVDRGPGLARGPALLVGSILLAFGLVAFLNDQTMPKDQFPDGSVTGSTFLGIGINGWTAWFCCVAGGLLLFAAAHHLLAKTMSLLVGLALGACCVIAIVDGHDVLGTAYANNWTKLGFGVAGGVLLLNVLMPRVGRRRAVRDDRVVAPAAAGAGAGALAARRHDGNGHRAGDGYVDGDRDRAPSVVEHEPVTTVSRGGRFDRRDDVPVADGDREAEPTSVRDIR